MQQYVVDGEQYTDVNAAGAARVSGEARHFGASQPRKEHKSSHGSVSIRAQTTEQILNLLTLQTFGESSRLTDQQLGTRTRSGGLVKHTRALALCSARTVERVTGLCAVGSHIARKVIIPEIAAILRFTVAGA